MFAKLKNMWSTRANREDIYSRPDFWNRKAVEYKGTAVSMFVNRTLNEYYQREQFRFYDDRLGAIAGRRILDVGCGTGRLSRHLAKQGASISAFDFAQQAVEVARAESQGMDIEYRVGSAMEIDAVAAYDDVVVLACLTAACKSKEEFEHVLRRIHAALRPGGRLVMIEPFHAGFLHRVLKLSMRDAIESFESCGFGVDATRQLHFWPARLALTVVDTPAWITRPAYHVGEFFMRLLSPFAGMGDYKGVSAVRRP